MGLWLAGGLCCGGLWLGWGRLLGLGGGGWLGLGLRGGGLGGQGAVIFIGKGAEGGEGFPEGVAECYVIFFFAAFAFFAFEDDFTITIFEGQGQVGGEDRLSFGDFGYEGGAFIGDEDRRQSVI